jgi:antitoxin (DNA-binding transcriptional repressor) of toxin-antitoxin stability system
MMPTTAIDIQELPARFDEAVSLAATGTDVIVTEGNVPRARLIPVAPPPTRIPNLHPGAIKLSDDFDAPLPDEFWLGAS